VLGDVGQSPVSNWRSELQDLLYVYTVIAGNLVFKRLVLVTSRLKDHQLIACDLNLVYSNYLSA
jgi:hypothetical protein